MPPCARMTIREARQVYRRGLSLVEPLFAILKTRMGTRLFDLISLDNVKSEWTL